jgi:hypothetical protein
LAIHSGKGTSKVIMRTDKKEFMRLRQIRALKAAVGTWKDEDHPELRRGAAAWVAKVRKGDEKRYRKVRART